MLRALLLRHGSTGGVEGAGDWSQDRHIWTLRGKVGVCLHRGEGREQVGPPWTLPGEWGAGGLGGGQRGRQGAAEGCVPILYPNSRGQQDRGPVRGTSEEQVPRCVG